MTPPPLWRLIFMGLLLPLAAQAAPDSAPAAALTIKVDAAQPIGRLDPFWKATGFMPATLLEKPVTQKTLRLIAATQPRAIEFLRPHYLLDLVTWENDRPQWPRFDAVMDFMVKELGFKLVFEVMGNPANRFDFTKPADVTLWRGFIHELVVHLQDRYGVETVRSWWFECTNEPDFDFFWKAGDDAFFAYYDATWDGIKAADSRLRFGGPANALGLNAFFKKFAAHVDANGRADFISVHRKFLPREMIAEERKFLHHLAENHPRLAKLPFLNTEADAEFGWAKRRWWRADAWYPAFIAQSIDLHLRELIDRDGVNYVFGINDHGFTGDFGQRTLYASVPAPDGTVALIKKPVMAGMELLAHLGDTRLAVQSTATTDDVGTLATRTASGELAVLLYYRPDIGPPMEAGYPEIPASTVRPRTVHLRLTGIGKSPLTLSEARLDETHGNPFGIWQQQGRPEKPDAAQLAALRAAEGPVALPPVEVVPSTNGTLTLDLTLPPSSLRLLILR